MTLSDEKSHLRQSAKALRAGLDTATRLQAAYALRDHLWPFLQAQGAKRVAVYLARPVEISLDPLIEVLLNADVEVSAPRLDLDKMAMTFHRLRSLNALRLGAWNVREPLGDEVMPPPLVLVPGLAFDSQGHRLGMGGGWYDRTLEPAMIKIGVCFDCQIMPHIPTGQHDHKMHWIFSEAHQLGPFD